MDALFDRARQSGADVGTSADLEPSKTSATFHGRARTLGVRSCLQNSTSCTGLFGISSPITATFKSSPELV